MIGLTWLLRRQRPGRVDRLVPAVSKLVSAAAFSLNHGGNDAQKTMGIIVVLLFSQGYLGATFPRPTRSRSGSCWRATRPWASAP